jgi:hypothetical protein
MVRNLTHSALWLLVLLPGPSFLHAQSLPAAEKQKIEVLIKEVGEIKDAKFIRNGFTYLIRFEDGGEINSPVVLLAAVKKLES